MYKYWPLMTKYYAQNSAVASEEDVYEWLLNSVLYALKHRSWLNPKSSIYNDPNGPDKVINRCMKCRRLTFYQALNRKKRKDGVMLYSLDKIREDFNDSTDYMQDIESDECNPNCFMLTDYIRNLFYSSEELAAFIMDIIINCDVFKLNKQTGTKEFSLNKLVRVMMQLDSVYFSQFAERYSINPHTVEQKFNSLYNSKSEKQFYDDVNQKFVSLQQFSYFSDCAPSSEVAWM